MSRLLACLFNRGALLLCCSQLTHTRSCIVHSCPSLAVVKSISDKGNSAVVTLVNGTQLTADYVIVTVPLGVLKEEQIKFTPPLPAAKQAAIKNIVSFIFS